ncbi:NADH-quinone oxidoreductase subunit A [Schaalia vaccimaxillae]|uniref:NADH-quinone oxidoreductase subunit A n=1 Tax=Schaalia vaccimaxillae TaxID=183916 RepID=UPI0003B6F947|nr:NADH-quinone oxidoreductase subunit A [Schaalia vaccimaxillae]
MTNPYFPLLIALAASAVVALAGLGLSHLLGPSKKSKVKSQNYECGVEPTSTHLHEGRFPIKYYLVAMLFIIFDIEVVFMYPWAVAFNQLGLFGLVTMLTFITLITVPYAYVWRRGGLDY